MLEVETPAVLFNLNGANPINPFNVGYSFAEALLGYFDTTTQVTNLVADSNTAKALQWSHKTTGK